MERSLMTRALRFAGRHGCARNYRPDHYRARKGADHPGLLPLRRKSFLHPYSFRLTELIHLPKQPGDYQLAIALVSQGKIDLKPLITHRFSFDQAIQAFQTTRAGKSEDGKPVIKAVISGPDVSPEDPL